MGLKIHPQAWHKLEDHNLMSYNCNTSPSLRLNQKNRSRLYNSPLVKLVSTTSMMKGYNPDVFCSQLATKKEQYQPQRMLAKLKTHNSFFRGYQYDGLACPNNPYHWVDDHPLLYGNNGSLDPSTYEQPIWWSETCVTWPQNHTMIMI